MSVEETENARRVTIECDYPACLHKFVMYDRRTEDVRTQAHREKWVAVTEATAGVASDKRMRVNLCPEHAHHADTYRIVLSLVGDLLKRAQRQTMEVLREHVALAHREGIAPVEANQGS